MEFLPKFSTLKILVHVHLYHAEFYPELKSCLKNFKGIKFDLTVSMSRPLPEIEQDIRAFKDDAEIFYCENRGYDIAPFIEVLKRHDLGKYDLIIKLHGKRDTPDNERLLNTDVSGSRWRRMLLSEVSATDALIRTLKAFAQDKKLGLAGHYALIVPNCKGAHERAEFNELFNKTHDFMKDRLGIAPYPENECRYLAGSMFVARAKLFEPLKHLDIGYEDFPSLEDGKKDGFDLAHVLERALGWLVTSSVNEEGRHYEIYDPQVPRLVGAYYLLRYRSYLFRKIERFVFRKETHTKGKKKVTVYKICKILKIKITYREKR